MFPFALASAASDRASTQGGDGLVALAPALRDASERLVAALVKNLQTMAGTATTIEGLTTGFASATPRDLVAAHHPGCVAALLECTAPACTIVATLDAMLVHTMVELLCGGNGAEPPPPPTRAATAIDQQFANTLVGLAGAAIQREWEDYGFGKVRATRIEGALPADACGPRVTTIGLVSIAIGAFGLSGTLRLALPPAALDAFGSAEAEPSSAPASVQDPLWGALLRREIGRAPIKLQAYLDGCDLALGAIADLEVGQILSLPAETRRRATLVCDGRVLYRGEVGQDDDRFSLRIDEIVAEPSISIPSDGRQRPLFAKAER